MATGVRATDQSSPGLALPTFVKDVYGCALVVATYAFFTDQCKGCLEPRIRLHLLRQLSSLSTKPKSFLAKGRRVPYLGLRGPLFLHHLRLVGDAVTAASG